MFLKKTKNAKKQLIIVKLDQIGDYILFRNFLEIVKNSELYRDYELTFLGNEDYKDLAEKFDKNYVDKFIWMPKRKFLKNKFYRKYFLAKLKRLNFDVLISPLFSRENAWTEPVVAAINADEKIGSVGDLTNITAANRYLTNKNYTKLIEAQKGVKFEFLRTKEFFETFLATKLEIKKPFINIEKHLPQKNYAVLFPGASAKFRKWSEANFAKIAKYLSEEHNLDIVICGSSKDKKLARKLIKIAKVKSVLNLCGKTKLSELPEIFAQAKLVISNDTSAYHMASAVDTKTICISNGNTFGRFIPYPKEVNDNIKYAFPDEISKNFDNYDELVEKYKYASSLDINNISVDIVCNLIDELIFE